MASYVPKDGMYVKCSRRYELLEQESFMAHFCLKSLTNVGNLLYSQIYHLPRRLDDLLIILSRMFQENVSFTNILFFEEQKFSKTFLHFL